MSRRPYSVRRKLLYLVLAATVPLVLAIAVGVTILGIRMWKDSIAAIETRTIMLHDAVDTALRESIVGYLRAKTETAVSTIAMIERTTVGRSEEELFNLINEHLLSFSVAVSGYIYVIDTDGRVVIHPDSATRDRVIPDIEPVRTQLAMRNGYLEYTWQNSFEPLPLPKALHMEEYAPREWIVSATAYREEFVDLVDRNRLAHLVSAYNSERDSYSVVVDRDGMFVVHRDYPGRKLNEFFDPEEAERVMNILFSNPQGQLYYSWPDRTSGERLPKLLVFKYMPDFNWVIATTIDIRALRRPMVVLGTVAVSLATVLITVVILLSLRLARTVSGPIVHLAEAAQNGQRARIENDENRTPRELLLLIDRFNTFIDDIGQQQASLQRSVHEKTVLVREIHHRVKNNLQVIASLLNLQSGEVANPEDAELFDRSRDRVISMALVHEQLYQTDNFASIPFDLYLGDLVRHIENSTHIDGVTVTLQADPISLNIDHAIPCGLIINELVTNAYKHAFTNMDGGEVYVAFHRGEQHYVFEVTDSGHGFSDGDRQSLGMTLVNMLVEQISGTIEVTVENGTRTRITFPEQNADK